MQESDPNQKWPEKIPKLKYNETLIHGTYSTSRLRRFAANLTKKDEDVDKTEKEETKNTFKRIWKKVWSPTAEDLIFLTLLGLCVAVISFLIDVFCDVCLEAHRWLYRATSSDIIAQYTTFVLFPVAFICFSTGFCHFLGPSAFGSGIPEVKTMLTGVKLKGCLSFNTFVSKVIGLSFSLASGMPLGKLGPFVHVGSGTASLLARFFPSKAKLQSFHSSILTAGAAVGVSCIFGTPIGGIMYSVEATATNYATENFWRCLYAAMCGAITFGFLTSLARDQDTILPFFRLQFNKPVPYDVMEIIIFIFLGLICGLLGALFVYCHQSIVLFIRRRKKLSSFLQKTRFLYPALVTFVIFSILFPAGLGQYMAGNLTLREATSNMFDNRTWTTAEATTEDEMRYLQVWKGPLNNPILTVFLFFIMRFWMCAIATTMPVPCGIFIPTFTLGAAFGRFFGECMAFYFPGGLRGVVISPGAYSIIGAATFSGAMSHTVSPAIIAFEMTGYLGHILPCVIGVCVAGATANLLRPSLYDVIIQIKNLPFLPPVINPHETNAYEVTADDMVEKTVECIFLSDTLEELLDKVFATDVEEYPVLNNKDDKIFMGSITTSELKRLIIDEAKDENKEEEERLQVDSQPSRKISITNFFGRIIPERKISTVSQNINSGNETEIQNIEKGNMSPVKMRRPSRFSITRTEDEEIKKIKQLKFKRDSHLFPQVTCWSQKKLSQLNLKDYVDYAAFHISNSLSLYKIHWVFSYLSIHQVFVTDKGSFIGILKLPAVLKAISNPIEPKPYFKQELERLLKIQ